MRGPHARRAAGALLLGAACAAAVPPAARAQVPPPLVAQPGGAAFERRELERRDAIPRAEPPAAPAPSAPAGAPAAPDAARFRLTAVVLEGNAALPTESLAPEWRGLIGREVTLADMEALTARLSARYRAAGLVLSQVVLPEQTVRGGVVRLRAVEGFLDRVGARGGTAAGRRAAAALLAPAAGERPLRLPTLERGLLLSRDVLGRGVEGVLRPSDRTFGAADLTAELADRRPVEAFAAFDNRSSRLLGPWVLRAGATARGLLGGAERLDATVAGAPGGGPLVFGQGVATLPILGVAPWLDGTAVQLSADHTDARPDLRRSGIPSLSTVQTETNLRLSVVAPLVRTRAENLYARLGIGWRESTANNRFFGVDLGDVTDRLLVVDGRLTWDFADRLNGLVLLDAGFRKGIAAGGVTQVGLAGPAGGRADFFLGQLYASRVQQFGDSPWSLSVEGLAQATGDLLPVSERFALGGERLGRGFGPGNTTGDGGFGGRLELRHTRRLPVPEPFLGTTQLYAFGDWGVAVDNSRQRDGRPWERLASVGLGARIDVTSWLTVLPEVATQVGGEPVDTIARRRHTRFLIGAVARY